MDERKPFADGHLPEEKQSPWDSVWMDQLYDYRFEDANAPQASVLFLKVDWKEWDASKSILEEAGQEQARSSHAPKPQL